MACGAFALDAALCDTINVPMEKLKWTSPFTSHRTSLSHMSQSSSRRAESVEDDHRSPFELDSCLQPTDHSVQSPSNASRITLAEFPSSSLGSPSSPAELPLSPLSQVDSGRGSRLTGVTGETAQSGAQKRMLDVESMVWATAVALAWLEHSSASYFIEWELVAAKASMWLGAQDIPEGKDLATVKAAANQLFIILRHWDENLHFNMLCYNPNSV